MPRTLTLVLIAVLFAVVGIALPGAAQSEAPSAREASARELSLLEDESWLLATTGKAGLLGFLGHRHAILASSVDAALCWNASSVEGSWAELSVDTDSLVIDSQTALRRAGMTRSVDEEQRAELREKMRSPRFLAVAEHPAITFETTAVRLDRPGRWILTGDLTIRGTTRSVDIPVRVERPEDDRLEFHGSLAIEHTQFGMEPESIAGVVRVADEIEIELRLVTEVLDAPCSRERRQGDAERSPSS